jgi:hypothetical protein
LRRRIGVGPVACPISRALDALGPIIREDLRARALGRTGSGTHSAFSPTHGVGHALSHHAQAFRALDTLNAFPIRNQTSAEIIRK